MKNFELEEKLAKLRKKWKETKDPIMKGVIERQAKALKEGAGDVIKKARGIFK